MIEISNRFCLVEPEELKASALLGDEPFIPSTAEVFPCTSKLTFSQSSSTDDAGTSWSMTFRAVTRGTEVRKWSGKRAFIGMIMTDGSVRYIGSADEQPLVTVTPYERGVDVVDASFSALFPIQL